MVETIYFFIQLLNTLQTGTVYLFELFVIYAWTIWIIKWIASRMYRPYTTNNDAATVAVIVPVLNEDPFVFNDCLKSIKAQNPNEFYVILDNNEDDPLLEVIAGAYAVTIRADDVGKRAAVTMAINIARSDIVVIVDSDTIFEPGCLSELKKPFIDPRIGGVTTKQIIFNPTGNITRRLAAWMEVARFFVALPAQSVFRSVVCLPGRAIAMRREAIAPHLDKFINEKFFGVKCITGDDRYMTSLLMKNGWDTVYQSTAVVYTDCPNTIKTFSKQQLRWGRSSQRETIASLPWIWKRPYGLFHCLTDMFTPFFFIMVMACAIYNVMTGNVTFHLPLWMSLLFIVFSATLTAMIRQYQYVRSNPKDIWLIPFYALFLMLALTSLRMYAIVTLRKNEWMTR